MSLIIDTLKKFAIWEVEGFPPDPAVVPPPERAASGSDMDKFMKADGKSNEDNAPQDFDAEQLKIGIAIEMEHTSDPRVAEKIAKDHLAEFPTYYTALVDMEKGLSGGGKKEPEAEEEPEPEKEEESRKTEAAGPTNQEVWDRGEKIDDWACDINPETGEMESNAGVEHIILYKGKKYSVVSDRQHAEILNPDSPAAEFEESRKTEAKFTQSTVVWVKFDSKDEYDSAFEILADSGYGPLADPDTALALFVVNRQSVEDVKKLLGTNESKKTKARQEKE